MEENHANKKLPSSYFKIFLEALPIASNYCIDMLPYTYGLILFKIIGEPNY